MSSSTFDPADVRRRNFIDPKNVIRSSAPRLRERADKLQQTLGRPIPWVFFWPVAHAKLPAGRPIEPIDALEIHGEALTPKQDVEPSIAEATAFAG